MPYANPYSKRARESKKRRQARYREAHRALLRERARAYYLEHSVYLRRERRVRQFKKLLG